MTTPRCKIVLNMIVKNEEDVIKRCLTSVVKWIDTWCIVDTGSTDRTVEIITDFFQQHQMAGKLHIRPWVDFEHNRNEALHLARELVGPEDYAFCSDADEEFKPDSDFALPNPMCASQYLTDIVHGCRFARTRLFKLNYYDWWYPTHESLCYSGPEGKNISQHLGKCFVKSYTDGARAKEDGRWVKDAESLKAAIVVREKGELWRGRALQLSRLYFYCANSYFLGKEYQLALENYQKRLLIDEFPEEIFQTYYKIGQLRVAMNASREVVMGAYLEAYLYRPTRYEPIYHMMNYLIVRGQYAGARLFAERMAQCTVPKDILFVEEWAYENGKILAKMLLDPSPSDSINIATQQYLQKQWSGVLETLKPLKLATLTNLEKFTYHDLHFIAYSWSNDRELGLNSIRKIIEMPLKHWKNNLLRVVGHYTGFYGQALTSLSKELQKEYSIVLKASLLEAEAQLEQDRIKAGAQSEDALIALDERLLIERQRKSFEEEKKQLMIERLLFEEEKRLLKLAN